MSDKYDGLNPKKSLFMSEAAALRASDFGEQPHPSEEADDLAKSNKIYFDKINGNNDNRISRRARIVRRYNQICLNHWAFG